MRETKEMLSTAVSNYFYHEHTEHVESENSILIHMIMFLAHNHVPRALHKFRQVTPGAL